MALEMHKGGHPPIVRATPYQTLIGASLSQPVRLACAWCKSHAIAMTLVELVCCIVAALPAIQTVSHQKLAWLVAWQTAAYSLASRSLSDTPIVEPCPSKIEPVLRAS
jgi:hypothetical protein